MPQIRIKSSSDPSPRSAAAARARGRSTAARSTPPSPADGLFGGTANDAQASYLSGLLIGHEIRDLADTYPADGGGVLLVGSSRLAKIYEEALTHLRVPFQTIDGEKATIKGLTSIWTAR